MNKYKIKKTDDEWKEQLSEEQYGVLRNKGTERPHSGKYNLHFENGASNARNFGASIASSKWVWFIDDDDFVSQSTIIDCIHACSNDLDMLMLPFKLSSDIYAVHYYSDITATYKYIRRFGHFGNGCISKSNKRKAYYPDQ